MSKALKIIFYTIGTILILLNILFFISGSVKFPENQSIAERIGYLTGSTLPATIGMLLIFIAYLIVRKNKKRKDQELTLIETIGKE